MSSTILSSAAPEERVFSKGYKLLMTKSISSTLYFLASSSCSLLPLIFKIPPAILGCKVFTRPSNMDGYSVISSTKVTGTFNFFINSAVPPVEIIFTLCLSKSLTTFSNLSLLKTEISAVLIVLFI